MTIPSPAFRAWAAAALVALVPAAASASQKVYSPIVEEGEFAVETRGHHDFDGDAEKDGGQKLKTEIEYGVTDRWMTGLVGEWERENSDDALHFSATAWENIFQLFPQGSHWLDAALYVEYEVPSEQGAADKAEVKLLLEKPTGAWLHTANLILEKEVGANAEEGTEYGYAWRSKWRWRPELEPGIEVYGEFGEVAHTEGFDEQTHQAGPVLAGVLGVGEGGDKIKYEIGYLFGLTDATPDGSLKWLLEYETHF